MGKIVKVVLALALAFVFAVSPFGGQNSAEAAAVRGGYVAATTKYSGAGYSSTAKHIDLFMNVNDANAYAAKLNSGWKASIAWTVAGYLTGVGPYVTAVSAVSTVKSQQAAEKILKLTGKKKKVHVYSSQGIISVKEWNGQDTSIKTSAPASKTTKTGGITTSIKTTVNKKFVKK